MRAHHGSLFVLVASLALVALSFGGCGAGGSDVGEIGDAYPKTATVQGKLASRDGEVTDLAGVEVKVEGDDEAATTDPQGDFHLRVRAHERVRIRVKDPEAAGHGEGDVVEIEPLDDDEVCEIEVEIVDGEVVEMCERREGDDKHEAEWHGAIKLVPPEDAVDSEAGGYVKITCTETGCRAVIEVHGLDGPAIYEAVLDHPENGRESLGLIEVSEKGEGRLVVEHGIEDPLPYGVTSLEELVGTQFFVVDDLGEPVLRGILPGEGARDDKDCDVKAADGKLLPPEDGPEPNALGWVGYGCKDECCLLVMEVGGLETTTGLAVYLVDAEGAETLLGDFEIGEKGDGRFAHETCEDLQGLGLILVDGDGATVLAGEVPTFGT